MLTLHNVQVVSQGNAETLGDLKDFMFAITVECRPTHSFCSAPVVVDDSIIVPDYQIPPSRG